MANNSFVIVETIRNISKMVNVGTEKGILALAITGVSQAKALAPVDNGQLRNSLQYVTGTGLSGGLNDSPGDKAPSKLIEQVRRFEAAIGSNVEYAPYVEFGTRYQAPQVYLRASLAILRGDAPKLVKAKMDYEFKKGKLVYGKARVKF